MSRWFRLYDDTINDPKVLKLSDKTHRIWIGILCIASKNNGALPPVVDMAIMLRMTKARLELELEKLIAADLIDHDGNGFSPHNWNGRQYKSDVSTERVKRFRQRFKTVSETPPDTESDTESERKEDGANAPIENVSCETSQPSPAESPSGLTTKYHFESGVIKLKERDFVNWEKAFSYLDLRAELTAIGPTDWAVNLGSKWFVPVSQLLARRNREQQVKLEQARAGGKTSLRHTAADPYAGII